MFDITKSIYSLCSYTIITTVMSTVGGIWSLSYTFGDGLRRKHSVRHRVSALLVYKLVLLVYLVPTPQFDPFDSYQEPTTCLSAWLVPTSLFRHRINRLLSDHRRSRNHRGLLASPSFCYHQRFYFNDVSCSTCAIFASYFLRPRAVAACWILFRTS